MDDILPLSLLIPPGAAGARIVLCGVPGVTIDTSGSLTLCEERLGVELDRMLALRVKLLVSLVEDAELAPVVYDDILDMATARGIEVIRLPIPDFGIPDQSQKEAWQTISSLARGLLAADNSVAFHCLAGIGRSGMMAGNLLVQLGVPGLAAVQMIRCSLPDAVETEQQMQYLLHGHPQSQV